MASQSRVQPGRYFAVLALVIAGLIALVFFTGPGGGVTEKLKPKLGLDLQGGTTVTLRATSPDGKPPAKDQLNQARQIIEDRVNGSGVAEFEVLLEGDRDIVINVPGKNKEDIRRIGQPAQLRFREELDQQPSSNADAKAAKTAKSGGLNSPQLGIDAHPTQASVLAKFDPTAVSAAEQATDASAVTSPQLVPKFEPVKQLTPAEVAVLPVKFQLYVPQVTCGMLNNRQPGSVVDPKQQVVACKKDGSAKILLDKTNVVGTDLSKASYGVDQGVWAVQLEFNSKGQDRWAKLTEKTVGKQVAVVLDNQIVSDPTIDEPIPGGRARISGAGIGRTEAKQLSEQLKYGALPLSFNVETAESVSPTLGIAQLKAGLLAGGIGLGLVVLYSLLYYRGLGLVTIASLAVAGLVVYASVVLLGRQMGFTLTLAGVAGFIMAVGITADSFVVYFERIKDEIRDGRSVRTAVPKAWQRALRTILSADFVSFLAAAVLYFLAEGAVKGFAFTLGLSTVVDLFIVMTFTHPLVVWLSKFSWFGSSKLIGLGRF
ncbi:MAG: protein translocase subunit SecD, partial [Mycobacteriales bacterium]